MPIGQYPFIDLAADPDIGARFARGEALVLFGENLDQVLWANGAGAGLFGFDTIYELLEQADGLQAVALRQLRPAGTAAMQTGRTQSLVMRIRAGFTSRAVQARLSPFALPDGGRALLLSVDEGTAARDGGRGVDPSRLIAGLSAADTHVAVVSGEGAVLAASEGFHALALGHDAVKAFIADVAGEPARVVKRMTETGRGRLPAAIGALTDAPPLFLLFALDPEPLVAPASADADASPDEEEARAARIASRSDVADEAEEADDADMPPVPLTEAEAAALLSEDAAYREEAQPAPSARLEARVDQAAATTPEAPAASSVPVAPRFPAINPWQLAQRAPVATEDADTPSGTDAAPVASHVPSPEAASTERPGGNDSVTGEEIDGSVAIASDQTEPEAQKELQEDGQAPDQITSGQAEAADQPVLAVPSELSAEKPVLAGDADEGAVATGGEATPVAARDEPRDDADAAGSAEAAAGAEPQTFVFDPAGRTVRFVWKIDAAGRFSEISPDFADAVGPKAADIVGRSFAEVADAFGIDGDRVIRDLLGRRDTWSGKSVLWPVENHDLRVPVDLAALPTYGRNRDFDGFRGFGIVRVADALAAPGVRALFAAAPATVAEGEAPVPLTSSPELAAEPSAETADERIADGDLADASEPQPVSENGADTAAELMAVEVEAEAHKDAEDGSAAPAPASDDHRADTADASAPEAGEAAPRGLQDDLIDDPFRGERPALEIRPTFGRRASDKVIDLHAHRPRPREGLSALEQAAFREIGTRLGQVFGTIPPEAKTERPADAQAEAEVEAGVFTEVASATEGATEIAGEADDHPADDRAFEAARRDGAAENAAPVTAKDAESPGQRDTVASAQGEAVDDGAAPPAGEGEGDDRPAERDDLTGTTISAAEADTQAEPGARGTGPIEDRGEAEGGVAEAPLSAPARAGMPALRDIVAFTPSAFAPLASAQRRPVLTEAFVDQMPVPILIHGPAGLFHANPDFLRLTGHGSIADLAEAGGLARLFDGQKAGDPANLDGTLPLVTATGLHVPVKARLQSIGWHEGHALMLLLTPADSGAAVGGALAPASPAAPVAALQPAEVTGRANTETETESDALARRLTVEIEELRSILETATDGVVILGEHGDIRSVNRSASALFNYDGEELRGQPFAKLFAHESQRAVIDYLQGLQEHGVASVLNDGREVIGREAGGGFVPLFMTIGRLSGSNGFCAVMRDITQWKRNEEELRNARRAAETASSHKSAFLARVSHEIRTPLNAIIGFSDMMAEQRFGPIGSPRYLEYAHDIARSGKHVLDIVNDLLDISKIEAGEMEIDFAAVALNDKIAEAVSLLQPQANSQRVIIRTSLSSSVPDVVADQRSIKQIALNLLANAIRFTPAGGQIVVSTAYEHNGSVVIRFRDTGIGMTRSELEQAMRPFRQVPGGSRVRGEGTGLGLPLTKAMVEANRAQFEITSTPDEGTLVEITFPPQRVLAD